MFIGSDTKHWIQDFPLGTNAIWKKWLYVCYKFWIFTFYDACEVRPQGYLILWSFSYKFGHNKKKSFQI